MDDLLYSDDGLLLRVTKQRASVGNTTYPIRNISSVSFTPVESSQQLNGAVLAVLGIVIFVAMGLMADNILIGSVAGGVLFMSGIVSAATYKQKFAVEIHTNAGRQQFIVTDDKNKALAIKAAIDTAIV